MNKSNLKEYNAWNAMKNRCNNPKDPSFYRYGGRGISVCDRWLTFENFLADMGNRPSKRYSLDRINNDGNYEPGNCRWATAKVQGANKAHTPRRKFTELNNVSDEYVVISVAAQMLNVKEQTVREYLARNRFKAYKYFHVTLLNKQELNEYIQKQNQITL